MKVRIVKVDEVQLLQCMRGKVWGSNRSRFARWTSGDSLAFVVQKYVAALAQICGEQFIDDEPIWENGLFPFRIPLEFTHFLLPDNRPEITDKLKKAFISGNNRTNYGSYMGTQSPIPPRAASLMLAIIRERPNSLMAQKIVPISGPQGRVG